MINFVSLIAGSITSNYNKQAAVTGQYRISLQNNMRRLTVIGVYSIFLVLVESLNVKDTEFEGTYTPDIKGYQALVPIKLDQDGEFLSYSLTQFYDRETPKRKKRCAPDGSDKVHYGLTFDGKKKQSYYQMKAVS